MIKLGAFGFTGLSRAQLAAAEQYYTSLADTVRYGDGDPSALSTIEDELGSGAIKFVPIAEWSPETIGAYELAHLGFYTGSPLEVQRHAKRLTEEFGVTSIAEVVESKAIATGCRKTPTAACFTPLRLKIFTTLLTMSAR